MCKHKIDKVKFFTIIFFIIAFDIEVIYSIIPNQQNIPLVDYLISLMFSNIMVTILLLQINPLYDLINGLIEIFKTIKFEFLEMFRTAPLLVSSVTISMLIIIVASYLHGKAFTYGAITTFLTYLAVIGALIFLFVPTGIDLINKKYKPYEKELFNENELSKTLISIMYSLSIFVMLYIIDILLGFFLSGNNEVFSFQSYFNQSNNILNLFLSFFSIIYLAILIIGLGIFIYGFLNIFIILKYFHFYEQKYTLLESNSKSHLMPCEIDWFIKKGIHDYPITNEIPSIEDFIDAFEKIKKDNPKLFNKEIIKEINEECNASSG